MVGSPSMQVDSSPRCFCGPLRSFDSLPSFYHWNEDEEDNRERKDFQEEDEKEEEEKIKINGGVEEDEEEIEIFNPRKKSNAFGSCEWSSTACFMENAPVSPSPICSPLSYISCSPPMEMFEFSLVPCQRSQCSSRRSNYGRPPVADEGKEREQQQFSRSLYQHKLQSYSLSLRKAMERSGSIVKTGHKRCSPQDKTRNGKRNILDKINAWKQAQTDMLLANLKKKEDGNAAWEWKQTNKARNRMKQIEKKLEEKRLRSFRKMQKRVNQAQKKAEEKKVKERIIYFNKISKLDSVAKKFTSGELSWLLLFL